MGSYHLEPVRYICVSAFAFAYKEIGSPVRYSTVRYCNKAAVTAIHMSLYIVAPSVGFYVFFNFGLRVKLKE